MNNDQTKTCCGENLAACRCEKQAMAGCSCGDDCGCDQVCGCGDNCDCAVED